MEQLVNQVYTLRNFKLQDKTKIAEQLKRKLRLKTYLKTVNIVIKPEFYIM